VVVLWVSQRRRHKINDEISIVFDLVIDTFFRDEPLNKCLAFDIPDEPHQFTELVVSLAIQDQCSFVAIDVQTQKVIGVILNIVKHQIPPSSSIEQHDLHVYFNLSCLHVLDSRSSSRPSMLTLPQATNQGSYFGFRHW